MLQGGGVFVVGVVRAWRPASAGRGCSGGVVPRLRSPVCCWIGPAIAVSFKGSPALPLGRSWFCAEWVGVGSWSLSFGRSGNLPHWSVVMPIIVATGAGHTVAGWPRGGGCRPGASSGSGGWLSGLSPAGELPPQVKTRVARVTFGDAGLNPLKAALLPTEGEGQTAWAGARSQDGLAEMFRPQAESAACVKVIHGQEVGA